MTPTTSAATAATLWHDLACASDGVLLYRVGLRIYEAKADMTASDFALLRAAYEQAIKRLLNGKEART